MMSRRNVVSDAFEDFKRDKISDSQVEPSAATSRSSYPRRGHVSTKT